MSAPVYMHPVSNAIYILLHPSKEDVNCEDGTYSTGFLRFNTNPSKAHNKCSTCGLGEESTTPLSTSCGPGFCSFVGKISVKRARNVTICYQTEKVSVDAISALPT